MVNLSVDIFVGNFSVFCFWVVSGAYLTFFTAVAGIHEVAFAFINYTPLYHIQWNPDPVDFFPSPSENLSSLPGEIRNFSWPVSGFPGATFTYPVYIICVCLKDFLWKRFPGHAKPLMGALWMRARMCTTSRVRSSCVTNVQSYRMFFCSFLRLFRFSRQGKSCVILLLSFFAIFRGWVWFYFCFYGYTRLTCCQQLKFGMKRVDKSEISTVKR